MKHHKQLILCHFINPSSVLTTILMQSIYCSSPRTGLNLICMVADTLGQISLLTGLLIVLFQGGKSVCCSCEVTSSKPGHLQVSLLCTRSAGHRIEQGGITQLPGGGTENWCWAGAGGTQGEIINTRETCWHQNSFPDHFNSAPKESEQAGFVGTDQR